MRTHCDSCGNKTKLIHGVFGRHSICIPCTDSSISSCDYCHNIEWKTEKRSLQGIPNANKDKAVCLNCYRDLVGVCTQCESTYLRADLKSIDGLRQVCPACISKVFNCDKCKKPTIHKYFEKQHLKPICYSCFNQYFHPCHRCSYGVDKQNPEIFENSYFCEACIVKVRKLVFLDSHSYSKTMGIKRHFSVEIECYAPSGDHVLNEKNTFSKPDGSLDSEAGYPIEYCIGILSGNEGLRKLENFTDQLNDNGHFVNKKCGLHVHFNAKDLNEKDLVNIASFFYKYDRVLHSILPKERRRNNYCQPFTALSFSYLLQSKKHENIRAILASLSRYTGFNLHAYRKYQTIEIRYHQGTIKFEKIETWLLLMLAMIEYGKTKFHLNPDLCQLETGEEGLKRLLSEIKLPKRIQENLKERFEKYNRVLETSSW